MVVHTYNSHYGEAEAGESQACWPDSLAYVSKFWPMKDPVSKESTYGTIQDINPSCITLPPPHTNLGSSNHGSILSYFLVSHHYVASPSTLSHILEF